MSNEEAVERIKHLIVLLKSPRVIMPYCKEELQALDLAIKALEEQERPTGEGKGLAEAGAEKGGRE